MLLWPLAFVLLALLLGILGPRFLKPRPAPQSRVPAPETMMLGAKIAEWDTTIGSARRELTAVELAHQPEWLPHETSGTPLKRWDHIAPHGGGARLRR